MPDSSAAVAVFNTGINDILNVIQKENKLIYVMDNLNISFLKSDVLKSTSSLLGVLYSYNVFPVIAKPTMVTDSSDILIDHNLKNNPDIDASHKQRYSMLINFRPLCNFHVAANVVTNDLNMINPILRLDMCHKNLLMKWRI